MKVYKNITFPCFIDIEIGMVIKHKFNNSEFEIIGINKDGCEVRCTNSPNPFDHKTKFIPNDSGANFIDTACYHEDYSVVNKSKTKDGHLQLRQCNICFLRYRILVLHNGKEVKY